MLGVGKHDCLTRVDLGRLVDESPEDVETAGRVDRAYLCARLAEQLTHHRVEYDAFYLGQKLLGWHFFAVGILDPLVLCERPQPRPDARDHEVCPGNAHVPQRLHPLPNNLVQFWLYQVLITSGADSRRTPSGDKKDARSEHCLVHLLPAAGGFCVQWPRLRDREACCPQCVHQCRPTQSCLVRIDNGDDSIGFQDSVGLTQ
jgi:hypothetical protein